MIAISQPLFPGHHRSQSDKDSDIITCLIRAVTAAGVRVDSPFITNFYLTLKAKRLAILTGPPQSGKIALVQTLAQVLTGDDPLQYQMMVGHAWWAGQSGNVGLFTQAQTRLNSAKILTVAEEALRPENAQRICVACLTRISPAEVIDLFSEMAFQLRHGQIVRLPGLHLTNPIPYPANLFLIGTMDVPQLDGLNPDLPSNLTVIQWPAVEAEPDGSKITAASHSFWRERRWKLMAKDPVCGMEIDEKTAAGKSEYKGQTYYFCSVGCKTAFDKEPEKYVGQASTHAGHH